MSSDRLDKALRENRLLFGCSAIFFAFAAAHAILFNNALPSWWIFFGLVVVGFAGMFAQTYTSSYQRKVADRLAKHDLARRISCPKCESLTPRGRRPAWQVVVSILFFPFGLLSLLAGRDATVCEKCGFTWMA